MIILLIEQRDKEMVLNRQNNFIISQKCLPSKLISGLSLGLPEYLAYIISQSTK